MEARCCTEWYSISHPSMKCGGEMRIRETYYGCDFSTAFRCYSDDLRGLHLLGARLGSGGGCSAADICRSLNNNSLQSTTV